MVAQKAVLSNRAIDNSRDAKINQALSKTEMLKHQIQLLDGQNQALSLAQPHLAKDIALRQQRFDYNKYLKQSEVP